jgi:Flp pilus assembly pilin Flp
MLQFAEALYGLYAGQGTEQEGQGLVEYALLLGFIALVMFAALAFLKDRIIVGYSRIGNSIPTS